MDKTGTKKKPESTFRLINPNAAGMDIGKAKAVTATVSPAL